MKALYTLVFVCLSYGALACDLDALNATAAVTPQSTIPNEEQYLGLETAFGSIDLEQTAAVTPQSTIPNEDQYLDLETAFGSIDLEWDSDATASILGTDAIPAADYVD